MSKEKQEEQDVESLISKMNYSQLAELFAGVAQSIFDESTTVDGEYRYEFLLGAKESMLKDIDRAEELTGINLLHVRMACVDIIGGRNETSRNRLQ